MKKRSRKKSKGRFYFGKHQRTERQQKWPQFKFQQVGKITGFAAKNAKPNETIPVLVKGSFISDQKDFHYCIEQLSDIILNRAGVNRDAVYKFLFLIHDDGSADLHLNGFRILAEMLSKKDVKKGEGVSFDDIADIRRLKFLDIAIGPGPLIGAFETSVC